jgi:hypothetical protein
MPFLYSFAYWILVFIGFGPFLAIGFGIYKRQKWYKLLAAFLQHCLYASNGWLYILFISKIEGLEIKQEETPHGVLLFWIICAPLFLAFKGDAFSNKKGFYKERVVAMLEEPEVLKKLQETYPLRPRARSTIPDMSRRRDKHRRRVEWLELVDDQAEVKKMLKERGIH